MRIIHDLFQKIDVGTFPSSFHEASITLIPKTRQRQYKKSTDQSISLMDIDAKILKKILASRIQQCKGIIHQYQVGFFPGMQVWLNIQKPVNVNHCINRLKKKYDMIIAIDAIKSI